MFLGKAIRNTRERKNLSREALAVRLDKSAKWVQRVELGKQRLAVETLFEVAAALEQSPAILFLACCQFLNVMPGQVDQTLTESPR